MMQLKKGFDFQDVGLKSHVICHGKLLFLVF